MTPQTTDSDLNPRFKETVKEKQLTYAAIAKIVGSTDSYVAQVMTGVRPPSKRFAQELIRAGIVNSYDDVFTPPERV